MTGQLSLLSDDPTTHWRCPKCGARVTVYIPTTATPRCARHAGGGATMKQEHHP